MISLLHLLDAGEKLDSRYLAGKIAQRYSSPYEYIVRSSGYTDFVHPQLRHRWYPCGMPLVQSFQRDNLDVFINDVLRWSQMSQQIGELPLEELLFQLLIAPVRQL